MEEYRDWIILGCVGVSFGLCIAVGLSAMRRTNPAHDFFMAGRNLGFIVTAVAVFSSTMSGFGFVGGPSLVYQMGMSSGWMIVCTGLSYTVCFFLLAKRLRILAEVRESISLPDAVPQPPTIPLGRQLSRQTPPLQLLGKNTKWRAGPPLRPGIPIPMMPWGY